MGNRQSMAGYFEHIGDKTYIDKYPSTIIRLENLRDAVFVEFGSGTCNDAKFLIRKVGLNPANLFLIEPDIYYLVDGMDKLEGCDKCSFFGAGECPEDRKYCRFLPKICPEDVLDNYFPDEFADFVYANNFLHCAGLKSKRESGDALCYELSQRLGWPVRQEWLATVKRSPRDKIRQVIGEAYRLLKPKGIFFGRTLSDYLDVGKLEKIQRKPEKSEKEEFVIRTARALQEGFLTGISPSDLEHWVKEAGFQSAYIEMKKEIQKPIRDFYFRCEK